MAYEQLLVKRDGDIATITLNRPDKRNALSLDVLDELTAAFAEVGGSTARGVVLAANGLVFSAGHNFADMAGATLANARRLFATCTAMMGPPRALTSSRLLITLSNTTPLGMRKTEGVFSSTRAMGPCFISAAG